MNPTPVEPRPPMPQSVRRDNDRPPAKANEAQRRAFEKLLSEEDQTEPEPDASAAWGLNPPPLTLMEDRAQYGEDQMQSPAPVVGAEMASTLPGTHADVEVPAPSFVPAPVQQANLYPHLAMPHGQLAEAAGRFEVLDGSMVTRVDVNTNPQGGMTVMVGTSVQHASLLDRYLPQLQRRLPEKASAHMRVQEREHRRD